jgi:peptide deformylase
MIRPIVKYGHPALRKKGARVEKITPEIRQLIEDLKDTMYDAAGVGLAAQQIGVAQQVTVIDVSVVTDRPSTLEWDGKPVAVNDYMPIVLINPEVRPTGEPVEGPEGCLSFPEIYSDIVRAKSVAVTALNESGEQIQFHCSGLLARAVQHEVDHLNGILFIDRMEPDKKRKLKPELDDLQYTTKEELKQSGQ